MVNSQQSLAWPIELQNFETYSLTKHELHHNEEEGGPSIPL